MSQYWPFEGMQVAGVQLGFVHTLATPPPPQTPPAGQSPQASVPPQPSPMLPQ
jgi:hypothetical protein